jgi:hypothetical protein
METSHLASNPFALMVDPAAVILAIEQSERLGRLKSRICRPLDKPLGVAGTEGDDGMSDLDRALDAAFLAD